MSQGNSVIMYAASWGCVYFGVQLASHVHIRYRLRKLIRQDQVSPQTTHIQALCASLL